MSETRYPEALITSPAEVTICTADHYHADGNRTYGVRHSGDEAGKAFAHCPVCGSTALLDTRAPGEVLAEARANVDGLPLPAGSFGMPLDPQAAVHIRWERQDVVVRVEAAVKDADHLHCSDCNTWALRAGLTREVAMV